jgi:hypothetical protein
MVRFASRVAAVFVVATFVVAGIAGCGPRQETIPVVRRDPLGEVRATLQNYVDGRPLTSEVTGFDSLVAEVRTVAPEKADILAAGLAELRDSSGEQLRTRALSLMRKLELEADEAR